MLGPWEVRLATTRTRVFSTLAQSWWNALTNKVQVLQDLPSFCRACSLVQGGLSPDSVMLALLERIHLGLPAPRSRWGEPCPPKSKTSPKSHRYSTSSRSDVITSVPWGGGNTLNTGQNSMVRGYIYHRILPKTQGPPWHSWYDVTSVWHH